MAGERLDRGADVLGGPVRAGGADVAGGGDDQMDGFPVGAQADSLEPRRAVRIEHVGDVVLVCHQSRHQVAVVRGVGRVEDSVTGHHDAADCGGIGDAEVARHLPQGLGGRAFRSERRGVLGHRAFQLGDGQVEYAGQGQPRPENQPRMLRADPAEFAEDRQIVHLGIVDQSVYGWSTRMDQLVYFGDGEGGGGGRPARASHSERHRADA